MAPHAGVIIAASVLVAAGIAVYESPEFREWIERSSQKVATAFRSIGDDIHGRRRRQQRRQDSSMHEDSDEKAEQRRRQAREEILEKGRRMQEGRKRRRPSADSNRTPSFDSMVDEEGRLRDNKASSSGVNVEDSSALRSRPRQPQMHESVDAPIHLRQLNNPSTAVPAIDPWESQYEQEMRNAWNIELPGRPAEGAAQSHASESLIDLTPSTDEYPDPDYSIPLLDEQNPWQRSAYFSAAASQHSRGLSENDTGSSMPLSQPMTPLDPRPISPAQTASALPSRPVSQHEDHLGAPSSSASMVGSTTHINHSEAEMTDDDLSEIDDGIRTPASAWTEVASSVSGDDLGHI